METNITTKKKSPKKKCNRIKQRMNLSPECPGSQGDKINNELRNSHHQIKKTSVPQRSVDFGTPGLKKQTERWTRKHGREKENK